MHSVGPILVVCMGRHASPMAYQFDGQVYIAIAAGGDILSFGLVE